MEKTHRKEALSSSDAKARSPFLGFVTHDPAVQPQLPQILIGNERRFTKKLLKELAAHTPPQAITSGVRNHLGTLML